MIRYIRSYARYLAVLGAVFFGVESNGSGLPVDKDRLVALAFDGFKAHEALPAGVPLSFDWARAPRLGAGNNSTGYSAATAWGQVFYVQGVATDPGLFAIRNFQTYLCTVDSYGPQWRLKQVGTVEGRQFRADFSANASVDPLVFRLTDSQVEASFAIGTAFHFWPKSGRFDLPSTAICGVLVLLEAKQITGTPNSLLIGLGADYWTSKSAPWQDYKTNKDIAIGRLKYLGSDWQWYGLTTATADALRAIIDNGYILHQR